VTGTVIEPGKVMSRATLTLRREKELVRGYSSMLPVVTAKDWQDIDFAVEHKVRTFEALVVARLGAVGCASVLHTASVASHCIVRDDQHSACWLRFVLKSVVCAAD
jgi:hypothetical protein